MSKCCFLGCTSMAESLFRIPGKSEVEKLIAMKRLGMSARNIAKMTNRSRICQDHFTADSILPLMNGLMLVENWKPSSAIPPSKSDVKVEPGVALEAAAEGVIEGLGMTGIKRPQIKSYCQFCLRQQTEYCPTVSIDDEVRKYFRLLTQQEVDTTRFSDFCCDLCSSELKGIANYRENLLKNRKVLEDLYNSRDTPENRVEVKAENESVFADFSVTNKLSELNDSVKFPLNVLIAEESEASSDSDSNADNEQNLHKPVNCHICEKQFLNAGKLRKHLRKVKCQKASNESFQCPTCDKILLTRLKLDRHIKQCARKRLKAVKVFTTETNKICKPNSLHRKEKKLNQPVKCPVCEMEFFYKVYLTHHMWSTHQDHRKMCPTCGAILKNTKGLRNHMLIHQEKTFQCDVCSKLFHTKSSLGRHKIIHLDAKDRPHKCTLCPATFTQATVLTMHMNNHLDIKFTCDKCEFRTPEKRLVRQHIDTCYLGIPHTRSKYLHKNLPLRPRRSVNQFVNHRPQEAIRRDLNLSKCSFEGCERKFSGRQQLIRHLSKTHSKTFENEDSICLVCFLQLNSVREYQIHHRTHTLKFACEICKKGFKTHEILAKHLLTHDEGEDRPFACLEPNCGATFKKSGHLRSHQMSVHSNERSIECDVCGSKFLFRSGLNVHMKTHSDERPYKCWMCKYDSKAPGTLRKHMIDVHQVERAPIYSCGTCQKRFIYHKEVSEHEKEHS